MYYWNQDNFDGLIQVADALNDSPLTVLLAEYCRLRECGLRRDAFRALDKFISSAKTWDSSIARAVAQQILELNARTPEAHQFLSQPLLTGFLKPTLEKWLVEDEHSQVALRWLGILEGDFAFLRKALELKPEDVPVRKRLVNRLLDHVDFVTHHIGESFLCGDLEDAKVELISARNVIDAAPDPSPFNGLLVDVKLFEVLIEHWEEYTANPVGTFFEWCANHGYSHRFCKSYYYQK